MNMKNKAIPTPLSIGLRIQFFRETLFAEKLFFWFFFFTEASTLGNKARNLTQIGPIIPIMPSSFTLMLVAGNSSLLRKSIQFLKRLRIESNVWIIIGRLKNLLKLNAMLQAMQLSVKMAAKKNRSLGDWRYTLRAGRSGLLDLESDTRTLHF